MDENLGRQKYATRINPGAIRGKNARRHDILAATVKLNLGSMLVDRESI